MTTIDRGIASISRAARTGGRFGDVIARVANRKRGSLKKWATAHVSQNVMTLQVTVDPDGKITGAWEPGSRKLETVRSVDAIIGGSHQEFAGMRTIHADDVCIAFTYQWGESTRIVFWWTL